MKHDYRGEIGLLAAVSIFGTVSLLVRYIPLSSAEIALWRAVIGSIVLGAVLLLRRERAHFPSHGWALFLPLLSGVALGWNWLLLFEAYRYTTVSVATLSYYFAPVLVTLLCPLLFRERMTPAGWMCSAMSALGLVLVIGTGNGAGQKSLLGVLFGLGGAVLYAVVVLCNKAIRDIPNLERTFLQLLAASLVLAPYVLLSGGIHLRTLNGLGFVGLFTVGILHTGVAYFLYFSSVGKLSGQRAAILSYADPLVALLVSVIFLRESITFWQLLGGGMLLFFALLNEILPKAKTNGS